MEVLSSEPQAIGKSRKEKVEEAYNLLKGVFERYSEEIGNYAMEEGKHDLMYQVRYGMLRSLVLNEWKVSAPFIEFKKDSGSSTVTNLLFLEPSLMVQILWDFSKKPTYKLQGFRMIDLGNGALEAWSYE